MRQAAELGISRRVLERRFVRLHPRVWCHPGHPLSNDDRTLAARLAMPARARLTGISRIQHLGLDFGPRAPIRFVVQGALHIAMDGVFLHRTKRLPPVDDVGVTPAAAFVAYCSKARVIDGIKVGDWLLHNGHMTIDEVRALALRELWRPGAHEAIWLLEHLDAKARSLPESEVRALLVFAGLERPELNVAIDEDGQVVCDLVYRRWRTVVEHEGAHHQEDRAQYHLDLGRYAWMRRREVGYVQSTHEKLRHPRTLVGEVYAELVSRGYDGPPPVFGDRWRQLFMRVRDVLGPRDYPLRR
jgi:hypothetical protein